MTNEIQTKIKIYLRNQLTQADKRLKAYTIDRTGRVYKKRATIQRVETYIYDFKALSSEPRWTAIVGLRGVGKTTLLAQIYTELECNQNCKLYISLDETKKVLGVDLHDILVVYEELLETTFEELKEQIFLFIDEIQYEENWELVLKSIYDRTKNIFIFCTGSSALAFQSNPDVSRRVKIEKLYPMSFTEYITLKGSKSSPDDLGNTIQRIILSSNNATEVFQKLSALEQKVYRYWAGIEKFEIDKYLKYGTLPFTLQYNQEPLIYEQIEQTLTNIIGKDIQQLGKFDSTTLSKLNQILYIQANTDITSMRKLSNEFNISTITLTEIFEIFEKCELLLRIYPHASHYGQAKKASKYLFVSPAYRSMFFNLIGSIYTYDNYKGPLLEDIVGLYLNRILKSSLGTSLTYDSIQSSADFIIALEDRKIAIEVGYGKKGFKQVEETLRHMPCEYGLSISISPLSLNEKKTCVSIPLSYFLLI